jgi:hypothetical protein
VFVVVTLFVALGIAAAQGCLGPPRGLDDGGVRKGVQEQADVRQQGDAPLGQQRRSVKDAGTSE